MILTRLNEKKGQGLIEYALVLALVIGFLYAVQAYSKNKLAGGVKIGVDEYTAVAAGAFGQGAGTSYAPTVAGSSTFDNSSTLDYNAGWDINSNSNQNSTQTQTF
jgi:hypothetical protein